MSTDPFQLARFEPLVGSQFSLHVEGHGPLVARLLEAQAGRCPAPHGRLPFSLTFEGPQQPLLPQRIYRVEHPELEAMEIFLVPVSRSDQGVQYEAVFN